MRTSVRDGGDEAGRAHRHPHAHAHAHAHGTGAGGDDERRIGWAFVILAVFTIVEVAGGIASGSLALLADAGHMVSDVAALGMSWAALRLGRRPADAERSYGYRRIEVLAAFVNGGTLFAIAGGIGVEAVRRLAQPVPVLGGTMLVVAVAGLLANLLAFQVLQGGDRRNLNMRGAWLHVLGDVLGFLAAIVAALAILWTGWWPIDPLLSLLVAALILRSAARLVRDSAHILLEGAPAGLDLETVRADLTACLPEVVDVHHVHAWSLSAEQPMITFHVRLAPGAEPAAAVPAISRRMRERFGVAHATIQVDPADCADEEHA